MKKHFARFVLLAALLASSPSFALQGSDLSGFDHETGILRFQAWDGDSPGQMCTATVLSSSVAARRTWLVTSAHCFSRLNGSFSVASHFANPRASVSYREVSADGTRSITWTPRTSSRVFVHPDWLAHGGTSSYFGPRDIALIRLSWMVPIYEPNGGPRITEYRRPIYTGPAFLVSEPFIAPALKSSSTNFFCGHGSGVLGCGWLDNLWYSPNFRSEFIQMPFGAWWGGFPDGGDGGGPLLKHAPGLAREWDGDGGGWPGEPVRYGAVLGVLQGQTVFCDYVRNGNCNPADRLVAHFQGIEGWLGTFSNPDEIPRISMWSMSGMFQMTTGSTAQLATSSPQAYERPPEGRIVGMAMHPVNGQLFTWYDDGRHTIGFQNDLDTANQRRTYTTTPWQNPRTVVDMIMLSSGTVLTYYLDGSISRGVPADLSLYGFGNEWYRLPTDKTPADIIGITWTPGEDSHVTTYYRDGTMSDGAPTALDYFGAPTPFNTGTSRSLSEIESIERRPDGATMTWYKHPKLF